ELGVRFVPTADGLVTAVRFYKGSGNTGTHMGRVWDAAGNLLGSVTFAGETATGWQVAAVATPVAVSAGPTYAVSDHAPAGRCAYTSGYFATGYTSGALVAPAGANGVYRYGSGGGFPDQTYESTNYWVDVVFAIPADTTAPTVTARSPAAGATGVSADAVVS